MSETWLLDANVISLLFEGDAEAAVERAIADVMLLATTARVLDEVLRADPRKRSWVERARAWRTAPPLRVLDMTLGTLVHTRLQANLHRYAPKDLSRLRDNGEFTCIAHAAEDPSIVLVTYDRNAIWRAIHELRPLTRVASALVFFDTLMQRGALDRAARDRLGELASVRDHRPTWWSALPAP